MNEFYDEMMRKLVGAKEALGGQPYVERMNSDIFMITLINCVIIMLLMM